MSTIASLLEAHEGRTITDVLAAIAEAQFREDTLLRQRDITDRLPVTKGAVSNNCGKLVEAGLVEETEEQGYAVVESALRSLYKEHIEAYLTRERREGGDRFPIAAFNDTRTGTKRVLRTMINESELVFEIVVTAIIAARDNSRLQTLREVVHHADHLIQSTATHVVTNPAFDGRDDEAWDIVEPVLRLAVVLEHVHAELSVLADAHADIAQYLPGDTPAVTMTTYFTDNP